MSETISDNELSGQLQRFEQFSFILLIVVITIIFLSIFFLLNKVSKKVTYHGKNKPFYIRKWFLAIVSFLLSIFILVSFFSIVIFLEDTRIAGKVWSPKLPDITKPTDFSYCEKDEDCTTTNMNENSCCLRCDHAVNVESKKYLEGWYKLNCAYVGSSKDCIEFECCGFEKTRCKNNSCTVKHNC